MLFQQSDAAARNQNVFWGTCWPHPYFACFAMTLMVLAHWLTVPTAQAADAGPQGKVPVGFVIISRGEALRVAENRESHPLKRRSKIYSGDEIKTGPTGGLQIKFSDGSIIALKSNTRLQINQFHYAPEGSSSRSFFQLLEGGIRAISGAIGKKQPEQYRLKTPMATIGIRGTHYAVALDEQMYVGVWEGGITLTNKRGSLDLGQDTNFQFASVASINDKPQGLLQPPAQISNVMDNTNIEALEQSGGRKPANATIEPAETAFSDRKPALASVKPGDNGGTGDGSWSTTQALNEANLLSDVLQTDFSENNFTQVLSNDGTPSSNTPTYARVDYPLGSVLSVNSTTNQPQETAFGNQGILAGRGSVGSDPTLLMYSDAADLQQITLPTPTWVATNADDARSELALPGFQSSLVPNGVTFGRWNVLVEEDPAGAADTFTLASPAYWLTADLSNPLQNLGTQSLRMNLPLFFAADTHLGEDRLRFAQMDLSFDSLVAGDINGTMQLLTQRANSEYDTALWELNLSGSLSERQMQLQVDSNGSIFFGENGTNALNGEVRGYLADDGTSFVGNVKLWDAAGSDIWLNGILGGTGTDSRLQDADTNAYSDSQAISLAASVSDNNLGVVSPLFRHDEGVFAGPAIVNGTGSLLRIADLWRMEDLSSSEIAGVEYFINPGTLSGLLTNVMREGLINDGVNLPQIPNLYNVNAWAAPEFFYDPLAGTESYTAPSTERLVWLLSRPASINDLESPRTALFDTLADAYFEDALAVNGDSFEFSVESSAIADFSNGKLNDFKFSIETKSHRYELSIPESDFHDGAAYHPGISLTDTAVRGTVCDLSDCENTQRSAHGEIRLSFLDKAQTLGGSVKLWDDNDLSTWISGVFTLAEDIRLNQADVLGLQDGKHAFIAQANNTVKLNNTIMDMPAFTISGAAITDNQGAPTLIKDKNLSYEGTIFRNADYTNVDVGSGTVGGETIGWGKWNAADPNVPTVESDFVNGAGTYDEDLYWISARPTPADQLPVGQAIYNQNVQMLGQLNAQDLNLGGSNASFSVNFDNMQMSGDITVSAGVSETATLSVTGRLEGPFLRADQIDVTYIGSPVTSASSEFSGTLVGDNAEGLTGAWHASESTMLSTSGVFVVEQQK